MSYRKPTPHAVRRGISEFDVEIAMALGGLGAFACVLLFAIPIGLLIGAAILRGAVSLANRCVAREPEPTYYGDDDDWADYPRANSRRGTTAKIPEPGLGRGMIILLGVFIVNAIVSFALQQVIGVGGGMNPVRGVPLWGQIGASLIGLPISYLLFAAVLTMMLPTSFLRACLVTLFYTLICIAIAAVIFVPLYAFGLAAR